MQQKKVISTNVLFIGGFGVFVISDFFLFVWKHRTVVNCYF